MSEVANYYISEVQYTDKINKDHISKVKVSDSLDSSAFRIWERSSVVRSIENDKVFFTKYRNNGGFKKGAKVGVVSVDSVKYLRTDSNKIKKDNLGRLPEF